jgi:hypothetical protein
MQLRVVQTVTITELAFKGGGERLAHGEVYLGCSSQTPPSTGPRSPVWLVWMSVIEYAS